MIARGQSGSPVSTAHMFHGARTADASACVRAVRAACAGAGPVFVGIAGFSLGGIIAGNQAARMGAGGEARVGGSPEADAAGQADATVVVSGCWRVRQSIPHYRARGMYHPLLAYELKQNFLRTSCRRFFNFDPVAIESASDVIEIDRAMPVVYNGYDDVVDYYDDMSAGARGKWRKIDRPFLVLHALDDPVVCADSSIPTDEEVSENPNIWVLATKAGGHVTWPQGAWPRTKRFAFTAETTLDFMGQAARGMVGAKG